MQMLSVAIRGLDQLDALIAPLRALGGRATPSASIDRRARGALESTEVFR